MKQDNNMSLLLDFYGSLLTEKQRLALEMYYNMDFSLAEIAENLDVTRQCARDFIKKGEAHLFEFEEKTGLCRRFEEVNVQVEEIASAAHGLAEMNTDSLAEAEKKITKSLSVISDIMQQ